MSNETLSPKNTKKRTGRKVAVGLAVFVACALLVQATLAPLDLSGSSESSSEQTDSLNDSPVERLQFAIPDADVEVQQALIDAQARLDLLLSEESAAAQASIEHALHVLETTLAQTGNLAAVPEGYLPGYGIEAPPLVVAPYAVPVLESTIAIDGLVAPVWNAVPSEIPGHPGVAPGVDAGELQAAIDEVFALIEDILAGDELQDVIAMLDEVAGSSPLGPLPLGSPDASDAEGVLAPHEEGASAAFNHAGSLLSGADGAIGDLTGEAQSVIDLQLDLVSQVQTILSQTEQTVFDASQEIIEESVRRGESTTEDLLETQRMLQVMLSAYVEKTELAAQEATSSIQSTVDESVGSIESAVNAEVTVLEGLVGQVESDTENRLEMLRFEAHRILVDLEESGASPAEIDAFLGTVEGFALGIQGQADEATALLEEAIGDFSSSGFETVSFVQSLGGDVTGQIDGLLTSTQSDLQERVDYATAYAGAQAESTRQLQQQLAQQTVGDLQELASSEAERLVDTTTSAVSEVHSSLNAGLDLLETVEGAVLSQVGSDLDYILKVAEDYGTAPVPEREERAAYWNDVYGTVGGTMDEVLVAGYGASSLVSEAIAISEGNLAGLSAL